MVPYDIGDFFYVNFSIIVQQKFFANCHKISECTIDKNYLSNTKNKFSLFTHHLIVFNLYQKPIIVKL